MPIPVPKPEPDPNPNFFQYPNPTRIWKKPTRLALLTLRILAPDHIVHYHFSESIRFFLQLSSFPFIINSNISLVTSLLLPIHPRIMSGLHPTYHTSLERGGNQRWQRQNDLKTDQIHQITRFTRISRLTRIAGFTRSARFNRITRFARFTIFTRIVILWPNL